MSLVRILHIEDTNEYNQEWIPKHYGNSFTNISVDIAISNDTALNRLTYAPYDAILYDLGLDRDGNFPIAHKIKDLKPGVLLIAMSGHLQAHLEEGELPDCFDEQIDSLSASYDSEEFVQLLAKNGIHLEKNMKSQFWKESSD